MADDRWTETSDQSLQGTVYEAITSFQLTAQLSSLQHAQMRQHLAEHLAEALSHAGYAQRAEVLRKAADVVRDHPEAQDEHLGGMDRAAEVLRRMAGAAGEDTRKDEPTRGAVSEVRREGFRTSGLPLATPCTTCPHPLNWHTTGGVRTACQVGRCGCQEFTPLGAHEWLLAQLEQARSIAVRLEQENARLSAEQQTLAARATRVAESHQRFIEDHPDPGAEALCAQYELAQTLVRIEEKSQPEPGAEPEVPWVTARHVLWTFSEDGGMRPGSFTQQLIDTCARADVMQLARLAQAYPAEAHAVHLAKNTEDGIARLQAIAGSVA
ncbi:hypothetical protein ACF082_34610 [Streptomyces lydicus]|uniref:hypothetical protein n=1 Tax=Streptomyces lydicus TaxID=47763 RepID=UPI0036FEA9CE